MAHFSRRAFVKASGAALALSSLGMPALLRAGKDKGRVIVIGGGYGGAIAAKYIRLADPEIKVTLIEKNPKYVSCPLSNEVLGGERDIESLSFGFQGLTAHGVGVMQDEIVEINAEQHYVKGSSGNRSDFSRYPGA